MRKGRRGRHDRGKHGKRGVPRHRTQSRASSDAQERAIETTERQGAQREIERILALLEGRTLDEE